MPEGEEGNWALRRSHESGSEVADGEGEGDSDAEDELDKDTDTVALADDESDTLGIGLTDGSGEGCSGLVSGGIWELQEHVVGSHWAGCRVRVAREEVGPLHMSSAQHDTLNMVVREGHE